MDYDKFLGQLANKTSDTTSQLGRKGIGFSTLPTFTQDVIEIWDCRKREYSQYEGTVFVVGHPTYGIIGSSSYPIGENTSALTLLSVTNAHNLFPENFENDRFIDETNSTGSYNLSDDYYYLSGNEYLQTDYIAYEDKIYKSLKATINCEYISSGSNAISDIEITGIVNGSDYILQDQTVVPITNFSTDGLKLKIENIGSDNIKLNNFRVRYYT